MALITKQGKPFIKYINKCIEIPLPENTINWSIRMNDEYFIVMTCVFEDKICCYYVGNIFGEHIRTLLIEHFMNTKGIIHAEYIRNFRISQKPNHWYYSNLLLCIYENKIKIIQFTGNVVDIIKIYDIYLCVSEMFTQPNTAAITVNDSRIIISNVFTSIHITTEYNKPCVVNPDYSFKSNDLNWLQETNLKLTIDDNNYILCNSRPFAYLTDDNFSINLSSLPHNVDIIKSVNQHTLLCSDGYYVKDLEKKVLVKLEEDECPYTVC